MGRGRKAKRLQDFIREPGTFIPSRHAHLLRTDRWLDELDVDEDAVRSDATNNADNFFFRLFEICLWYRHAARTEKERQQAALAFRDAILGDWHRYDEFFWRGEDGVRLTWRGNEVGDFVLGPCECRKCSYEGGPRAYRAAFFEAFFNGLKHVKPKTGPLMAYASRMAKEWGYRESDVSRYLYAWLEDKPELIGAERIPGENAVRIVGATATALDAGGVLEDAG